METDYYLHNFHVKEGRGMNFSMDFYRHGFGIQHADAESETLERPQRSTRNSSVDAVPSGRKSSAPQIAITESQRVKNVRRRVAAQNEVLSVWWKRALHSNLQRRIWMKNSNSLAESDGLGVDAEDSLPPRYDRLYQPEKMALFDRFFARGWATPLRSSHTALHGDSNMNETGTGSGGALSRVITTQDCSSCLAEPQTALASPKENRRDGTETRTFLGWNGFEAPFESSSKFFVEPHDRRTLSMRSSPDFVGDLSSDISVAVPEEYMRYCTPSSALYSTPLSDNEQAEKEFMVNMRELSLQADDVDGIRKVCVGRTAVTCF